MYFYYILYKYFKNFLLIMFSLSFFYVVIDLIANYEKLPDSSNLQVLYIYYVTVYSFDVFYSLAIVFSFLFTVYYMIKFNELVSFYSLGFTVKKLLKPFLFMAFAVFFVFVSLESSKFAYFRAYADAILSKKHYTNTNLFIKYQDKIVYIKRLNPIFKTAEDIKIFYIKDNRIEKIISAHSAVFNKNIWHLTNAKITSIDKKALISKIKDVDVLKNFRPKIISNLKNLSSISLYDAYIAIKIFKDVNVNTLLSMVFFKIFTALGMIGLIIVLFFHSPIHQRISNVSIFLVKSILLTILVWGLELMLYKFAKQDVISPYVLILPAVFIYAYGIYLFYKEK